jgi:carbonic anhydrase
MTEQTLLRQIVEANKSFIAGNPRLLDPAGEPFLVVSCIDPRLTGLLEPALGLPRHRAAVIRTAGNQLSERTKEELRSIAVALFVKNAREIIIVGHTDCGMAGFSAPEVTENFRRAGIPRSAFGNEDLRTWFGAFPDVRANVVSSVEVLRKSAILPPGMKVHGLVMETDSGAIEVVVDGNLAPDAILRPVVEPEHPKLTTSQVEKQKKEAETAAAPDAGPPPRLPPASPKPKKGPIVVGQPVAAAKGPQAASPDSLLGAAMILREFLDRERHSQQLQRAATDLKSIWRTEKSPSRIIAELGKITSAYEAQYPGLPAAISYLENAIRSGRTDRIGFSEVMKRLLD